MIPNPWLLAAIGFVLPSPLNLLADAAEARRADRAAAIGGVAAKAPSRAPGTPLPAGAAAGRAKASRAPWARVFWSDGKGMAEGWFVSTERSKYPRRLFLANRGAEATTTEVIAAVRVAHGDSYGYENTKVYRLG